MVLLVVEVVEVVTEPNSVEVKNSLPSDLVGWYSMEMVSLNFECHALI